MYKGVISVDSYAYNDNISIYHNPYTNSFEDDNGYQSIIPYLLLDRYTIDINMRLGGYAYVEEGGVLYEIVFPGTDNMDAELEEDGNLII